MSEGSAERVSQTDMSDNYVFQRSLLAYREAASMVSGAVLEIGTGNGYGIELVSPSADSYTTIDKCDPAIDMSGFSNAEFRKMKVPPLEFASNSFDWVISFQVIEHIKDDFGFLAEVLRVLKHGGRFIVTTPNSKVSLTRNPWHVREYTPGEFTNLMECHFDEVRAMGVFGNDKVAEYYRRNRESVERITRFDPLRLQYHLPRWMLKMPYDMLNRINRNKLLKKHTELTAGISAGDYRLAPASDQCFDLLYVGTKS